MTQTNTLEKNLWKIFSYIFHPLFIPIYMLLFLHYIHPEVYARNTTTAKNSVLINAVLNLVVFPLLAVLLMKALKFVNSIFLETQKERIAPLFVYAIFTFGFWAYGLLKNPGNQPSITTEAKVTKELMDTAVGYAGIVTNMGLALFVAASLALMLNSFFKISLHMMGAGLLLGFAIVAHQVLGAHIGYIVLALLISISVLLSRKYTSTHTLAQLVIGFVLGLVVMIVCEYFF